MPRYGAAVSFNGVNTANTAYCNLDNTNNTKTLSVVEIILEMGTAPTTAPFFCIARTTTRGTQASTLIGQANDSTAAAATGTLDVCGTGASQPAFTSGNKMRATGMPLTVGTVFVWTFYDVPIIVPATTGAGLCVFNANASGATTGLFVASYAWDE